MRSMTSPSTVTTSWVRVSMPSTRIRTVSSSVRSVEAAVGGQIAHVASSRAELVERVVAPRDSPAVAVVGTPDVHRENFTLDLRGRARACFEPGHVPLFVDVKFAGHVPFGVRRVLGGRAIGGPVLAV